MKKVYVLSLMLFLAIGVNAQKASNEKTEIRKEVNLEEKNGVKVLTVKTVTNGVEETEVFKGEAAEEKLAEIEAETARLQEEAKNDPNKKIVIKEERVSSDAPKSKVKSKDKMSVKKEVSVEEKDGVKTVVVTTTKNGQMTSEVYRGEEAEKVLREMEKEAEQKGKKKQVEIEVEED